MPEGLSKFVLALEAGLITTPLTALYLFAFFPRDLLYLLLLQGSLVHAVTTVVTVLSLLAGWSLMVNFWRYGAAGLRTSPSAVWGAAYAGAAGVVLAPILTFVGQSLSWKSLENSETIILVYGIPLLVPFFHLVAERFLRTTANTSRERTRAG
jgi:hypothetical protein